MNRLAILTTQEQAWGGSEELWAATALEAAERGIEVRVSLPHAARSAHRVQALQAAGVIPFFRPPRPHRPGGPLRSLGRRLNPRLGMGRKEPAPWKTFLKPPPDILLVSQGSPYCALRCEDLDRCLLDSGIPFAFVCHSSRMPGGVLTEALRQRARILFQEARWLACVARDNLAELRVQLADPLRHGLVVQNPVPHESPAPLPWPAESPARLACVGRLQVQDKGQDLLLAALADPAWLHRDWTLTLVGDGPDRTYLQNLAAHLGLNERVTFTGAIDAIEAVWKSHHLLVLPSRSEGTPLVLHEAMSAGRCCVATDVGGHRDWIQDATTGFLSEAASVRSFRKALETAWQERPRWAEMGNRARDAFRAKRDPHPGATLLNMLRNPVLTGTPGA